MGTMITTADTVELQERVRELKKLKNAVILAHNYQVPERRTRRISSAIRWGCRSRRRRRMPM